MIRTPLTELLGISYPIVAERHGLRVRGRPGRGHVQRGRTRHHRLGDDEPWPSCGRRSGEKAREPRAPFGVNIRADAPDAAERVELIIGEGVPVASFALAPAAAT